MLNLRLGAATAMSQRASHDRWTGKKCRLASLVALPTASAMLAPGTNRPCGITSFAARVRVAHFDEEAVFVTKSGGLYRELPRQLGS